MNHALGNIALGMLLGYALARGMSRRQQDETGGDSARTPSATTDAAGASVAPGPGPGALYPGGSAAGASPAR